MNKDEEKVLLEEPVSTATQTALSAPIYTPATYKQSAAVTSAQEALQKHSAQAPGAYTSKWQAQLDDTVNKILNREEFSYDVNGDALYKQYADQYARKGKAAMEDTIARASAMTGGYGNSYAQTAGQATYAQYMTELADKIPELYQLALDKYNAEGDALYDRYSLLSDAEGTDYDRYRDSVSDYLTERDYLTDRYDTEYARDYGEFRDKVSDNKYSFDVTNENYWKGESLKREDEQTQYERDLTAAYAQADLGDFSALSELLGIDAEAARERYTEEKKAEDELTALEIEAARLGVEADKYSLNASKTSAALERAYVLASSGDYSALAEIYDCSEERAKAYFEGGLTGDETLLYGGYTKSEYTEKLLELKSDYSDPDTAAGLARAAGTDEAEAIFKAIFGDEVYKEYFGGVESTDAMNAIDNTPVTNSAIPTYGGGSYVNAKTDFDKTDGVLDRSTWEAAKASGNQSVKIRGYESYDRYIESLASELVERGWSADKALEWASRYLEE